MRASMSVPGAFDPVAMGQHLLVDGGLADNVPIDVVRKMGADIVIAVDVGTPLEPRDNLKTLVSVTAQLSGLLVVRNSVAQIATLTDQDVLIRRRSARTSRPRVSAPSKKRSRSDIRVRSESAPSSNAVDQPRGLRGATQIHRVVRQLTAAVQFVKLDNRSRFTDAVIRERLHIPLGKPLDTAELDQDIQQIYALGFLDIVRYDMIDENGKSGR